MSNNKLLWSGVFSGDNYRLGTRADGSDRRVIIERLHRDSFGGERWELVEYSGYQEEQRYESILAIAFEELSKSVSKRTK